MIDVRPPRVTPSQRADLKLPWAHAQAREEGDCPLIGTDHNSHWFPVENGKQHCIGVPISLAFPPFSSVMAALWRLIASGELLAAYAETLPPLLIGIALVSFGGVEKYKEEGREARGFYWLDSLSLDARLGLRMLGKHRWLTLVGGFLFGWLAGARSPNVKGIVSYEPGFVFPQGDVPPVIAVVRTRELVQSDLAAGRELLL